MDNRPLTEGAGKLSLITLNGEPKTIKNLPYKVCREILWAVPKANFRVLNYSYKLPPLVFPYQFFLSQWKFSKQDHSAGIEWPVYCSQCLLQLRKGLETPPDLFHEGWRNLPSNSGLLLTVQYLDDTCVLSRSNFSFVLAPACLSPISHSALCTTYWE